jgi:two-component system sensor histidine kinase EvgS
MAKILIVDDEEDIRLFFSIALSDAHKVWEAEDGQQGLSIFSQHQPDLIITDLNMPIMSGWELIAKIRAVNRQVKIIATTALGNLTLHELARITDAGANICLPKPVSALILKEAIVELLQQPRALSAVAGRSQNRQ